jgi:hypothetical protein
MSGSGRIKPAAPAAEFERRVTYPEPPLATFASRAVA